MRVERVDSRKIGRFVHVEVAPGVFTVVAEWMLDASACTGMEIGAPRASLEALADLDDLLKRRGLRGSCSGETAAGEEQPDAGSLDQTATAVLNQVRRDLEAVQFLEMAADVAHAHPARVHRDDLVIEPVDPGLPLADQLRLEAAVPIGGNRDLEGPVIALHGLARRAIAVPRQRSTGGKVKLGSVSKMGQTDIRRLLIVGAMSVIRWVVRKGGSANRWLAALVARKPKMVAAVALANKMARTIWAVTTKQEDYRMA